MAAQTKSQDCNHNFDYYDSLYKEHLLLQHQEVKEICNIHAKQDLIDLYTEYISELDELFNYPNRRGDRDFGPQVQRTEGDQYIF